MRRHLTVRDLSGTRILGDFTPPAGASPAVSDCLASLAHVCAREHEREGAVIWSAYQPVSIYRTGPWGETNDFGADSDDYGSG